MTAVATPESTANAPNCTPTSAAGTSVTQSASSWGDITPVQLIASTASAITVWGFAFMETSSDTEFDLMTGGAGAEVVKGTCTSFAASGGYSWSIARFGIPIEIGAGVRVSVRTRKKGTTTSAYLIKLLYYPSVDSNCGTVTDGIAVAPAAADSPAFTSSGSAWTNTTPTELHSGLTDIAVIGILIDGPAVNLQEYECDVCTGAAASEVARGTVSWAQGNGGSMAKHFLRFGKPIYLSGTNRISYRVRSSEAAARTFHAKLQYVPIGKLSTSSVLQATTSVAGCTPDASALGTLASNNSGAWAQSNWLALDTGTATAQVLTGLTTDWPGVTANDEVEFDLGVGGAGSEVVIATYADAQYALSGPNNTVRFPIPVDAIPASSRVSVRFRKKSTTARTVGFGYEFNKKPL